MGYPVASIVAALLLGAAAAPAVANDLLPPEPPPFDGLADPPAPPVFVPMPAPANGAARGVGNGNVNGNGDGRAGVAAGAGSRGDADEARAAGGPGGGEPRETVPERARRGIMGFFDRLFRRRPPDDDSAAAAVAATRSPARYALEVAAPEPLEQLIREHTLLGRWRFRADFDQSQLPLFVRRARPEVEELLAAEGYFEPQIEVETIADGVRIVVQAGPRTTVNLADVRIGGVLADPAFDPVRDRIRQAWLLPEGSFFQSNEWERAKRDLLERAQNQGFLRARIVSSEALVNLETTAASLRVELDSGEPVSFGELEIRGLQRYRPSIVQGLRSFRTGQPYRYNELVEFQTRLNGSGYFNTVNVQPDLRALERDPALDGVPIRVDVVEAPAKKFQFGGGYDTDRGFNVMLGFENKNLLDTGLQSFSGLELDLRRQLLYTTLDTPYDLSGRRWQFGARAQHNDVRNDITQAESLFLARGFKRGDDELSLSLQYQYERQNVLVSPVQELLLNSQAIVLGAAFTRRRLDSPIVPSEGYVLTTQLSGATDAFISKRSFVRAYASALGIVPVSEAAPDASRFVLRAEGGMVFAGGRDGIPSQILFRTGGTRSVRGYPSQSLGAPLGEATVSGRYLLVGSVEYQHPIVKDVHAAVFYDRGNASDSRDAFTTVAGYGVGVRWRTPVGPLNFDIAYGEANREWRLHFSVGVVF